jgi:hypothetical protein
MDLERLTHHQNYHTTVMVALVLSGLAVTFAALVGRGTLNLKGALLLDEPTDITVIALMEPKLSTDEKISKITFLRKEAPINGKATYSYLVKTTPDQQYFLRVYFEKDTGKWATTGLETLHGEPGAETPLSQ